ncbi:winged helix-turn-helix domain-containing protein [Streptomyces sp. LP05-1]|uniref:Winged helix-turn-helix domain-containing protein n=1 Tax=Streptomyces pyxinae TaxID=2970734 RepID=A0ABT2CHK0_9ACTN|nr:BTAD domain-containing putative transcriptional regulator [Streptomyces sp. LP05-1]MCS0636873.1 winged helix-turn-helix domain-containing protein [Streptomyces sp. LP05-1]
MTTTAAREGHPDVPVLTAAERAALYALGCGLADAEIADALALPEPAVAGLLGHVMAKLGLRDRAGAIVHAFDCGLVVPGRGPRRRVPGAAQRTGARRDPEPAPGPWVRISVLGPLRAWVAGQPVDIGPLRQQAVLAVLAMSPDRSVGREELLSGVWGMEYPGGNAVPVYVYRLRKSLRLGQRTDAVITRDRNGYRLARGVAEVDAACMEDLATAAGAAERAGDLAEAVRLCGRALELFHGEPLAGLPGPAAEAQRLRLVERRAALVRRRAGWQSRLGRIAEATAELSALVLERPLDEPAAAQLMGALRRAGRPAEAVAVFDRARRRLAEDLGVAPGDELRRARGALVRSEGAGAGPRPGRAVAR